MLTRLQLYSQRVISQNWAQVVGQVYEELWEQSMRHESAHELCWRGLGDLASNQIEEQIWVHLQGALRKTLDAY